ncbi:ABC transporter ATP-binding protein [Parvularcula sp. LCG005]|uniref:ABC transporter ATP-binding protein n=1 Tax=Parvularcula sp. LCG005 TaxID=3078805 RepID=UPI002943F49E|nr:ABC transporter ATP-binding protein [Parvularcula sp. LCG005]WOI54044.1 ABC transporter ATP-binding protein [Parvularcula sp. LCG005]
MSIGGARRLSTAQIREAIGIMRPFAWTLPVLIVFGLISSLAETAGVTLIIFLLYALMGRGLEATEFGGGIGSALNSVTSVLQDPGMLMIAVLFAIFIKLVVSIAFALLSAWVSNRLGENVQNRLHQQYLDVDYDYIRQRKEGEMLKVIATESWSVPAAYNHVSTFLINATAIVVMTAVLFLVSWQITLIAIVGVAILMVAVELLTIPARRLGRDVTQINEEMAARTLTALQGMRVIRAFGQERFMTTRFQKTTARARKNAIRLAQLSASIGPLSEVGYIIVLAVIVAVSQGQAIPFATTLTAVALLFRLQTPLYAAQGAVLSFAGLEAQLKSVLDTLHRADKSYPPQGEQAFSGLKRHICFRDVTFHYGDNQTPALDAVSFEIPAGKTTAIIGKSGAGKSTLLNMLVRLDRPQTGGIDIDGVPIDDIERSSWLSRVAIAGQDVDLIDSSVEANIRMSRLDATDEQMKRAIDIAGVKPVIDRLEDGLRHWIGPSGANLSGGQRQRIGLARALLTEPDILILDEATSALDQELEALIRRNLEQDLAGKTIIIVTHRLQTITDADHAIVIDQGRVVAEGLPRDVIDKT